MGWNDHVEFIEMRCLNCGNEETWEIWDDTAKQRYGGDLGLMLGRDIANDRRCPNCGSRHGEPIEEEDD